MSRLAADLLSPLSSPDVSMAPPPPSPTFSEAEFCDWLASAEPGKCIEYYRGFLAVDRMPSTSPLPRSRRMVLVAVAKRAMQAAEEGRVHLVQRRHEEGDYSYFAIVVGRSLKLPPTRGNLAYDHRGPGIAPQAIDGGAP